MGEKNNNFILNKLRVILESAPNTMFCLLTETKRQTFRRIPGFYSTNSAVDFTPVIFCARLVVVTWEVFTTTSTREIQICARPATQLTGSFYFRQIVHASPLHMREDLSKRCLFMSCFSVVCLIMPCFTAV